MVDIIAVVLIYPKMPSPCIVDTDTELMEDIMVAVLT
jgi:hypothetical protein